MEPPSESFDDGWWAEGRKNAKTVKEKIRFNVWDHIDVVIEVLEKMKRKEWSWARNHPCKYLNLTVDMRDGGCLIHDKDGNRINPEDLRFQYGRKSE
jgi:hypothetical protein